MKRIIRVKNIIIGQGKPKICVPIVGKTREEIDEAVEAIKEHEVDLVEWRVDYFEEVTSIPTVIHVLKQIRKKLEQIPIIFTFRTVNEGGNKPLDLHTYKALYQAVINTKDIDLIDVELFIGDNTRNDLMEEAKQNNLIVILSNHDFHKTPSKQEIINRLTSAQQSGADIAKIAVMPKTPKDVLVLLDATYTMIETDAKIPIITMAMDQLGILTRTSGEIFGSSVTFASVTEASAPGQVNITQLKKILTLFH
ncbi:3-dehydroquinate dehydratase [Paraliobacillus sp. PM-2]|uniref:type I 3-dehydroquinate dehydratase n=1 Tax=Paraliobacillus sp. PM-2 TaxID=1462524 RepID=UPI00061BC8CC|nr:type I 3-dehydroquinate dehydratase [Paraliobacillus sp. PM-2]CQR46510.1 3-dehydroquinate dehydratase [Paraliobacillus sp. PM-2]